MKTRARSWVAGVLAVGAVASLVGCGGGMAQEASEEPKGTLITPTAPVTSRKAPGPKPSTIVIIVTEPPPGLQAPSAPERCWYDRDQLYCDLVDGSSCSFDAGGVAVACE
jgi:hypothetical protein